MPRGAGAPGGSALDGLQRLAERAAPARGLQALQRQADGAVLQAVWVLVTTTDGSDARKMRLRRQKGSDLLTLGDTGRQFRVVDDSTDPPSVEEVPATATDAWADLRPQTYGTLRDWSDPPTGPGPKGVFSGNRMSATHNRGAPFLGTRQEAYNGAQFALVGKDKRPATYENFVKAMRSAGKSDEEIAKGLLRLDPDVFTTDLERRGADMIVGTVALAEEWRKQGAGKIFRAYLRLIAKKKRNFDSFMGDFAFVKSADAGRRMVGRFQNKRHKANEDEPLPLEEDIYDAMSDLEEDDLSSDDEMRAKKTIGKRRLYAVKHRPQARKGGKRKGAPGQ
ncbi:MAG: hypothetical protein ACXIUV_05215 [Alkalilacustris sp.]